MIDTELEHVAGTLDLLIALDQYDLAAHVLAKVGPLWEAYGYAVEGLRYASAVLPTCSRSRSAVATAGRIRLLAGNCARHQGKYRIARRHYAAALQSQRLPVTVKLGLLGGAAEASLRQGDYRAARTHYHQYGQVSLVAGRPTGKADALTAMGRIDLAQGDLESSGKRLVESRVACETHAYVEGWAWAQNACGELHRARHEYDRAIACFQESRRLFADVGNPGARHLASQNQVATLLALGQTDDAEQRLPDLARFWLRGQAVHPILLSSLCMSLVVGRHGDHIGAARLLVQVERRLTEIGLVLDPTDRALLDMARSRLERRLTPRHWVRLKKQEVSTDWLLADYLDGRDKHDQPQISTREREVLSLLEHGLSDRQIAGRLRMSPHTVNAHLRKIFAKLDVRSRTEAVYAFRERLPG